MEPPSSRPGYGPIVMAGPVFGPLQPPPRPMPDQGARRSSLKPTSRLGSPRTSVPLMVSFGHIGLLRSWWLLEVWVQFFACHVTEAELKFQVQWSSRHSGQLMVRNGLHLSSGFHVELLSSVHLSLLPHAFLELCMAPASFFFLLQASARPCPSHIYASSYLLLS